MSSGIEAELLELKKQARISLESNRSKPGHSDETQRLISTQRSQIEKLKSENKQLQEELNINSKVSSVSQSQHERIIKLNELVDTYSSKVEVEGRQLESILQELDVNQAKVHELRKVTGGTQAAEEAKRQSAKIHLVLENRLEQAEKKLSEILAKNREMREQIESINKQREALEQARSKAEKELMARKSELANLQELTSLALEAKKAALAQLESLKTQADKEQALYESESHELVRSLEADQKLLEAQAQRLGRLLEAPEVSEDSVQEEEGGLSFQEVVNQLAQAADIDPGNLPELVCHYRDLESVSFSAFNECNTANEKIGAMQKKIREMETEARHLEVSGVLGKQKEAISLTLQKRDQTLRRAEVLEEKRVSTERCLAAVKSAVAQVLKSLGCTMNSSSEPLEIKEASEGPPLGRVQQQLLLSQQQSAELCRKLGQLEIRSRAVLAVWSTLMGKTSSNPLAKAMLHSLNQSTNSQEPGAARGSTGVLHAPGTEGAPSRKMKYGNKLFDTSFDDSSEGEDELPLTREQITERLVGRS